MSLRTICCTLLTLVSLMCGGAKGAAVESPNYECRWTPAPPAIDGHDDDAVWQLAQVVENFRLGWLPGTPAAREGTRARLLWDREFLYFFARMDDADVAATVKEHDGPMWQNDVFEIFLKPSPVHAGYYEFEVNPHAAIVDAFFPTAESRRNRAQLRIGQFHLDAKVTITGTLNDPRDRDTGWTVEGRIPWSDLAPTGGRPVPGEVWHVNFARVNGTAKAQELSSAAALTQPSFHRTEEYAPLKFVGPAPLSRGEWPGARWLASPEATPAYQLAPAWPKLEARSIVALAPFPGGPWLWFVDQHSGRGGEMRLRRLRTAGDGSDAETLLEPDEQMTSFIFHPRFAENGYVYFGTNGPRAQRPRASKLVRYSVRADRPDPASRLVIIEWPSDGHNGGGLAFGGDGKLFLTSGDGSSDGDRDRVGQDPLTLRAKILRLDVDHPTAAKNYSVPSDNPYVADARFAPETWAYGMRNPWRLTYDPTSGQLWCGENGQDAWEYAHLVQRGANYGWSAFEGSHRYNTNRAVGPTPISPPTLEFPHAEFRSLTGGIVYRGKQFPELVGAYVFGDFGTGRLWAAHHDGKKVAWMRELIDTPLAVTHVTADADGELLLADYGFERARSGPRGGIYRLARRADSAAIASTPSVVFPTRLSSAGLFADLTRLTPAPGVLAYAINAPGWHDGATGTHHLALPTGSTLELAGEKTWGAPDGTVLVQTLTRETRRIETRVLVKNQEDWAGYTYVWTPDQRDAVLAAKSGADLTLADGTPWRVPSRAECMMCHTREAEFTLTLREPQLNVGDQLSRWEALGLLRVDPLRDERGRRRQGTPVGGARGVRRSAPNQRPLPPSSLLPRNPAQLDRYASPTDSAASLEKRALTYLAVNCAHCHSPAGGGNSAMNFEWGVPPKQMHAIAEAPQHGDYGIADAHVISPSAPGRSVLIPRVASRGEGQMPPVASRVGDPGGVALLAEWILSLPP